MSQMVLFSLIVSPLVEDAVIDLFLEHEAVSGFTSYPINGHGTSPQGLTPAEKVSGRQRQLLFQIHLEEAQVDSLLESLNSTFSGSGFHYWILPVLSIGRIQ